MNPRCNLRINIKTSRETFVRKLVGYESKWWEAWLYKTFKTHLQNFPDQDLRVGRYDLRGGFSQGDQDLYSLLWRLILWRKPPKDYVYNFEEGYKEITITLHPDLEKWLYYDIER